MKINHVHRKKKNTASVPLRRPMYIYFHCSVISLETATLHIRSDDVKQISVPYKNRTTMGALLP